MKIRFPQFLSARYLSAFAAVTAAMLIGPKSAEARYGASANWTKFKQWEIHSELSSGHPGSGFTGGGFISDTTISGSSLTLDGSAGRGSISIGGSASGAVRPGNVSVVNFNADAGGISLGTIGNFSQNPGIINIDTNGRANGVYDLFTFGGYFDPAANSVWGTENITGLLAGQSGSILYDPAGIQLEIIPEPSTYAAIFGGLALVGVMIRRRFRK